MQRQIMRAGPITGRVWREPGYGAGLMIGTADPVGQVLGHTGSGPFSSTLVAHFPDLERAPFVASFADTPDEAQAEVKAVALAAKLGTNKADGVSS